MKRIQINGHEQTEHIKLLQGAFRSKIVLLLIAVVITWGLWATLQYGDSKTVESDAECEKLRQAVLSKRNLPSDIQIGPNSTLTDVFEKLADPKRPEVQKLGGLATDIYQDMQVEKDKCRQITEAAYLVKARVPYLVEPISISGLLLADFWPFVMMAIASAVVIFQFRERTNAIVLSGATSENPEVPNRELLHVRSNYRIGLLRRSRIRRQTLLIYSSPLIVQPESLFVWTLLVLTLYTSFSLEAAHRIEFSHEMKSVLFDYISGLWFYCIAILYLVYRTWDYYEQSLRTAFGLPVIGKIRFKLTKTRSWLFEKLVTFRTKIGLHQSMRKLGRIADRILALAALTTLILPWMTDPVEVRGYSFLIRTKRLDEGLAIELQCQLWLAVLFVLLCIFLNLTSGRISRKALRVAARLTWGIGLAVFVLLGNLFFHLLVLQIIDLTSLYTFYFTHVQFHPLLLTNPEVGLYLFSILFIILRWRQSSSTRRRLGLSK